MKEIRAVFRPDRLHALREALREIPDFPGLTVIEVKGFSAPALINNPTMQEELILFADKVMIYTLVRDNMVDSIVDVVVRVCQTGRIGDGIVWSLPVETARRIQDGSPL
jgi:nitrogen regulatory protein P-II 1